MIRQETPQYAEEVAALTTETTSATSDPADTAAINHKVRVLERRSCALFALACLGSVAVSFLALRMRRLETRVQGLLDEIVTAGASTHSPPLPTGLLQTPTPTAQHGVPYGSTGQAQPPPSPAEAAAPPASILEQKPPLPPGKCCKAFESRQELLDAIDTYLELLVEATVDAPVLTPEHPLTLQYGRPIGAWDVSRITDFSSLLERLQRNGNNAQYFNEDISQWDVSSATNMSSMFRGAQLFDSDISDWNVANVQDMSFMFGGHRSYGGGTGSVAIYNQPLENWDVSNVVNMESMFFLNTKFNQSLATWNVSRVKSMKSMFERAVMFNGDVTNWDVSRVEDMSQMFGGRSGGEIFSTVFNQSLSWDTSSVQDMRSMFAFSNFNAPLKFANTSNVRHMDGMFYWASNFNQPLSTWDTSKVVSMASMFSLAKSFDQPLQGWNVSQVTTMEGMFRSASCFNQPLDAWDVGRVTSMEKMFALDANSRCNGALAGFNQDIAGWQVSSSLGTMQEMFRYNKRFNHTLCAWGKRLKRTIAATDAFYKTACEDTSSPNMGAVPPGPFCSVCSP